MKPRKWSAEPRKVESEPRKVECGTLEVECGTLRNGWNPESGNDGGTQRWYGWYRQPNILIEWWTARLPEPLPVTSFQ